MILIFHSFSLVSYLLIKVTASFQDRAPQAAYHHRHRHCQRSLKLGEQPCSRGFHQVSSPSTMTMVAMVVVVMVMIMEALLLSLLLSLQGRMLNESE